MRSRTLDNSTQASNQGVIRVSRTEYVRYAARRRWARPLLLCASYLPVPLGVIPFLNGGFRWRRFSEHFLYGDTNPAIVVDAKRRLVASYTDLDVWSQSRFHVVKVFRERLRLISREVKDGDTFAAVSLYSRASHTDVTGRWGGFSPIVVDCVVRDQPTCDFAKAKIPGSHWRALRLGLEQLRSTRRPGTYDIILPNELLSQL